MHWLYWAKPISPAYRRCQNLSSSSHIGELPKYSVDRPRRRAPGTVSRRCKLAIVTIVDSCIEWYNEHQNNVKDNALIILNNLTCLSPLPKLKLLVARWRVAELLSRSTSATRSAARRSCSAIVRSCLWMATRSIECIENKNISPRISICLNSLWMQNCHWRLRIDSGDFWRVEPFMNYGAS